MFFGVNTYFSFAISLKYFETKYFSLSLLLYLTTDCLTLSLSRARERQHIHNKIIHIVKFLGFDMLLHVILLSNVTALKTPPQRLAALRLHPLHLTLNQRVQLLSKLKYFIFVRLIKKGSLACTFCGHCTSGFLGSCGSGSFLCRQDNQSPRDSRYASPPHDRSFDPSSVKEFLRILIF